ncbi:hypothetical protein F5X99DRAFT_139391 [Biscogniauxia marginata]|nr:hypothetical protein F5X99DRAFT_139391 [Biscogniauxia marginata]
MSISSELSLASLLEGNDRDDGRGVAYWDEAEPQCCPKPIHRQRGLSKPVLFAVLSIVFLSGFGTGYLWRSITSGELQYPEGQYSRAFTVNIPDTSGLTGSEATASGTSTTLRTFRRDPLYTEAISDASNSAWERLIPKGRGFVKANISGIVNRYCVSAFHQLHCLDMLRHGYYAAIEIGSTRPDEDSGSSIQRQDGIPSPHMQHCFDFIRQSLMCAADPTLEKRNETIGGVTGWGSTHQCRDFEALKEWTEKHRYSDADGIQN